MGLPASAQPSSTTVQALQLAGEAASATDEKDFPRAIGKLEQAIALRPDLPRLWQDLAIAQTAAERADDAIASLQGLAALGVGVVIDKADEFAALRAHKSFPAVMKRLADNLQAKGTGEIAFTLRNVTGLFEGIAWREKTGEFFFGDVNGRAVWRRQKDGALQRHTPEGDELWGVFGLVIDEANGALWASTSAVSAMRGFTPELEGSAALAEFDLDSGAVRRIIPLSRPSGDLLPHVLGDLALGEDGGVVVTDSRAPTLWRLAPGGRALEPFVVSDELISPQGIVFLPSGALIADQTNGLVHVDLAQRRVRRLEPPVNTTLVGVDGLTLAPDGQVLAIQNGIRPNRVLRLEVDAVGQAVESVVVLESAHLAMAAPSLGCIGPGGDFYFIGNAGWTRFENNEGQPSTPRAVPIFRTKLPKPRK